MSMSKSSGASPPGGGWRALGASRPPTSPVGFDYVHAAIDDHSRVAYAEIHPDETGATCAGFLGRAAAFFATCGITRIERVMTDNAFGYRRSRDFQAALVRLGARQVLIRPHCPWQNGKVERLNRTLQANGRIHGASHATTSAPISARMARVLQHPTPPFGARGPSADQQAVTNVVSGYS